MKNTLFTGAGTALVTPMNDSGIDYDAYGRIIDFQIENGADALIVCATTGEAPTLDDDEHLEAVSFAVDRAKKRIPVIAGTGSNNTAHAIMMNKEAEKRGADGLLWVSPYYNKATQKGLLLHYKALAASTSLPAIIYNVPSRTGVNIKPETIEELSYIDNICGVKEASGDVSVAVDILRRCGDRIDVYSGNDDIIVPLMSMGAKGVISVISNVMPRETHDMCRICFDGDFKAAAEMQKKYFPFIKALFCEVNPIPIKTAMNLMGLNAGKLRLPLCEMSEANLELLKSEMKKLSLI